MPSTRQLDAPLCLPNLPSVIVEDPGIKRYVCSAGQLDAMVPICRQWHPTPGKPGIRAIPGPLSSPGQPPPSLRLNGANISPPHHQHQTSSPTHSDQFLPNLVLIRNLVQIRHQISTASLISTGKQKIANNVNDCEGYQIHSPQMASGEGCFWLDNRYAPR